MSLNKVLINTNQVVEFPEISYIDNPEFAFVKTDNEDRILYGVKQDGEFFFGARCPQQVRDYINEKLAELSLDEYEDIVTFLADYLGSDTTLKTMIDGINAQIANKLDAEGLDSDALKTVQTVENPEYIEAKTDSEGKLLAGRTPDGAAFENVNFATPKVSIDGHIIENIEDQEERSEVTLDSEGKIISYMDSEGVKHESVGLSTSLLRAKKIEYSQSNIEDIVNALKVFGFFDTYDQYLPKILVSSDELEVYGNDIIGLDISKNEVACKIAVISTTQKFVDENCLIAYQGNSSLGHPKKGFTLDFGNAHRFGNWLAFDSFHAKGYYNDWLHLRDWLVNSIIEQCYNHRDISESRPYSKYNNFSTTEIGNLIEGGALCHTDEFPVELFVNGHYWGLYSFRIKKSRENYMLSKNNVKQIQVEAGEDTYYTDVNFADGGHGWNCIEIRNPKKDSGNTKFEEGVEPNAGEVKTAWQTFIQRLNAITDNTTVEELEVFLNVDEWVDAILIYNFSSHFDIWCKNTLYCCWDSNVNLSTGTASAHWSPCLYDFDTAFSEDPTVDVNEEKAYQYCPWLRPLQIILSSKLNARYKELRDAGVFSYDNIKKLVNERTKQVGTDVYKRDTERWTYPSLADENPLQSVYTIMDNVRRKIIYMDNRFGYNV